MYFTLNCVEATVFTSFQSGIHVVCLYGGRCSSENSFYSLHMYYEDTSLRRLLLAFGSENYVFVNDWHWCRVLRYIVTLEWYSVFDFIWTTLDGFYTTHILLKLSIMHLAVHEKMSALLFIWKGYQKIYIVHLRSIGWGKFLPFLWECKGPSVNEILIEISLRKRLDDANICRKGLKMASIWSAL